MQEKEWVEKNKILVMYICFSTIVMAGISWIKYPSFTYIIRNTCISGILLAVSIYKFFYQKNKGRLSYNNNNEPLLFIYSLCASFVVAILCSFISPLIWPLIPIAVLLSLFSDSVCGIISYIYIISIPIMLTNADNWVFMIYIISGIVAVFGFEGWERDFKSVKQFVLLAGCLLITQSVSIWMYSDFNSALFIILPAFVNLFVNIFLVFFVLKQFTVHFLKDVEDQYMDINDQSYILMEKLKEDSIDDYYRCIHTAHFSDILSKDVNADSSAVRTAAYYYRFGVIYSKLGVTGNDMGEYMLLMMDAHHFPQKARSVIEELCSKKLVSKESALVYISDYFIKSISFLMKAKPDDKPDWDKCVDYVFDKSLDENLFEQCAITVGELKTCMTLLKRDKMYYEFLCRK